MKENGFILKKARRRRYPAEIITDADYANDPAHIAITPGQAKFLLHSLEQVARGIGLSVNSDKREFMCSNHDYVNFSLNGEPLIPR